MSWLDTLFQTVLVAVGLAQCPTSADLDAGVVLVSNNGATESTFTHRRVSGELYLDTQVSSVFPDRWVSFRERGAFLLYQQKESGTAKKDQTYDPAPHEIGEIAPGNEFVQRQNWGNPDGSRRWQIEMTTAIVQSDQIQIGSCAYDAVEIQDSGTLRYPDGSEKRYAKRSKFLPELSFLLPNNTEFSHIRAAKVKDGLPSNRDLWSQASSAAGVKAVLLMHRVPQ
ncbi:hypothetical protein [Aliiroseovarius halocynthiae]|uniref:Uncharacterized protein n=1 Tax=Aliiroseovarius halocynthiae TaxID=985055 RepID=A0A545SN22_9RHOB|nr:hypothetical protein [Aliiroseovarius halocynthiae]TQV66357.1 hypothetical protein FIL88_13410 [Aliiroseovarius halocynthiae]